MSKIIYLLCLGFLFQSQAMPFWPFVSTKTTESENENPFFNEGAANKSEIKSLLSAALSHKSAVLEHHKELHTALDKTNMRSAKSVKRLQEKFDKIPAHVRDLVMLVSLNNADSFLERLHDHPELAHHFCHKLGIEYSQDMWVIALSE